MSDPPIDNGPASVAEMEATLVEQAAEIERWKTEVRQNIALVKREFDQFNDAIGRGKGTWPNPTYVKDSTWEGWLAIRSELATILFGMTGETPEFK